MPAREWTAVAAAAQSALDDLEQVMHAVAGDIRDGVPAYAMVSDDELAKTLTPNVKAVLLALRDRRRLLPAELAGFTNTVEQRARDGVALDDYLSGIAFGEVGIWEQVALRAEVLPDDALAEARVAYQETGTETEAAFRKLPGVPIRILSATQSADCDPATAVCRKRNAALVRLQKQWLSLSPTAVQVKVEAGHDLPQEATEAVVAEIMTALTQAR